MADDDTICTARDGHIRCVRGRGHDAPHIGLLGQCEEPHRWLDSEQQAALVAGATASARARATERDAAVRALMDALDADIGAGSTSERAAVRRFYPEGK